MLPGKPRSSKEQPSCKTWRCKHWLTNNTWLARKHWDGRMAPSFLQAAKEFAPDDPRLVINYRKAFSGGKSRRGSRGTTAGGKDVLGGSSHSENNRAQSDLIWPKAFVLENEAQAQCIPLPTVISHFRLVLFPCLTGGSFACLRWHVGPCPRAKIVVESCCLWGLGTWVSCSTKQYCVLLK